MTFLFFFFVSSLRLRGDAAVSVILIFLMRSSCPVAIAVGNSKRGLCVICVLCEVNMIEQYCVFERGGNIR